MLVLNYPIQDAFSLFLGLVAVIVGLAVFMEGLNVGLMPFGTIIGNNLPKKTSMFVVLIIIGILGVGLTFAEPAIGALQAFGSSVDVTKAPYLYEILNNWTLHLVFIVGAGVGALAAPHASGAHVGQPREVIEQGVGGHHAARRVGINSRHLCFCVRHRRGRAVRDRPEGRVQARHLAAQCRLSDGFLWPGALHAGAGTRRRRVPVDAELPGGRL